MSAPELLVAAGVLAAGAVAAGASDSVVDAGAAVDSLVSIITMELPMEILSPTLTRIEVISPAIGAGISILALSLSTVSRDWSSSTVSPSLTRISMISTSLKSPMSGTSIVVRLLNLISSQIGGRL